MQNEDSNSLLLQAWVPAVPTNQEQPGQQPGSHVHRYSPTLWIFAASQNPCALLRTCHLGITKAENGGICRLPVGEETKADTKVEPCNTLMHAEGLERAGEAGASSFA